MNTPSKDTVIELLRAWIKQRAGMDPRDYGSGRDGYNGYRSELRRITQQRHDAERLLQYVENSQITADELVNAFSAYSGRLQLTETAKGYRLEYCTGQYFPTEYRAAVCAVLASAIWYYLREPESTGDSIRAAARRIFGRSIAGRWFN